jgi:regulator of sigma E protease
VNWTGVQYPAAILASPASGSIAANAGLIGGERVESAGFDDNPLRPVQSFEDLRWLLTRGVLEKRDVRLLVTSSAKSDSSDLLLRLSAINSDQVDTEMFQQIGIVGPFTRPAIGPITVGGAAERAGLHEGDIVRTVGAVDVTDGQQLRRLIRASGAIGDPNSVVWKINRGGSDIELIVKAERQKEAGLWIGRIGAYVGAAPELVVVRYGVIDGLWRGLVRSWDVSLLTIRMMGRMMIGEASLKNLSGPLTIADYAGKSASSGMTQYLLFLALISVSLGVLNLLPLPVLDGGHLMYYLWEGITGKSVSDAWMEYLQRGGVAVLMVMMSIAIFNDINRLFG